MDLLCFPEPPCLRLAPTFGNKTTKVGLRSPGREEENKAIPALLKHKRKPYPEVGTGVLQKMGARSPLGKEAVLMSLREDGAAPCCRTPLIQESYKLRRVSFPPFVCYKKKKLMIRPHQVLAQVILGGALGPLGLEVTNRGHYQDVQDPVQLSRPKFTYNYNEDKRTDCC